MSVQFNFAKGALLAATASASLFAAPQLAAAQPGGPDQDQGGYGAQGSYNNQGAYNNQGGDPRQGPDQPPPPPAPGAYQQDPGYGPPPPPPGAYAPGDEGRYAGPGGDPGYREPSRHRCQMVEDRVMFPDGTSDSRSVRACRGPDGHWRVADDGPPGRD